MRARGRASELTNCGGYATCLSKNCPRWNKGTLRHKKERQASRTLEKEKIWGAGGDEALAIDLFCRCVCGKSALYDCCCKDTDRPIKFGGGGKRY